MHGEMAPQNMTKMSQIMSSMSKELKDVSRTMQRGQVSDEQMQAMQSILDRIKTDLSTLQH